MVKKQFPIIAIQALLLFVLIGCASSVVPASIPPQVSVPSSTPFHSAFEISPTLFSEIASPTPARNFPDENSTLQEWDFGREGLTVGDAFITNYGRHLVVAFDNPRLMVHNFETGQSQIFRSPVDFAFLDLVDGISSSPDGVLVVEYSPNESGDVTLWQISEEEESRAVANIIEAEYFVTAMEISPDGETLALGYNNGEIRLFRTSDGALTYTIQAHGDFVMSLAFSWDSRYLLSDSWSFDPFTYVFSVSDGSKIATLSTESYEPGRISFSPDNQLAAVTSFDGTHIYSTSNWADLGFIIPTFEGKFTCDSKRLLAVADGHANIYSGTNGDVIKTMETDSIIPYYCLYDGRAITINVDAQNTTITLNVVED